MGREIDNDLGELLMDASGRLFGGCALEGILRFVGATPTKCEHHQREAESFAPHFAWLEHATVEHPVDLIPSKWYLEA